MTKYILAGGNDRESPDYGNRLYVEIAKTVPKPNILGCFFALPPSAWLEKFQVWRRWLAQYFDPATEYKLAKPEVFSEQIKAADVIYLYGGNTKLLTNTLNSFPDLERLFEGKVVVGSSAGANYLSNNYWSSSKAKPGKGTGILDVNIMVHYGAPQVDGLIRTPEDWRNEENVLKRIINDDTVIQLPEGQFMVIEKSE